MTRYYAWTHKGTIVDLGEHEDFNAACEADFDRCLQPGQPESHYIFGEQALDEFHEEIHRVRGNTKEL